MKKFIKYVLFTFVISIGLFCFAEISLRSIHKVFDKIPFTLSPTDFHDSLLGWTGKKIFGNPDTDQFKILVVGDSYTDGVGADETQMYYRVLEKNLNAELFIYGGGGYGSLQEYLLIDHYLDEIKPDLVIIQACSNDLINNSWELEKLSYSNNNLMVRPYLINDTIKYYYPRVFGQYRVGLIRYSRIMYMLFNSIDVLNANLAHKHVIETVENQITKHGKEFIPYSASLETTKQIYQRIKQRLESTPLVVTISDTSPPYFKDMQAIFNELQIPFLTKPTLAIEHIVKSGVDLSLPRRGHWNEQGHQIFGNVLLEELKQLIVSGKVNLQ